MQATSNIYDTREEYKERVIKMIESEARDLKAKIEAQSLDEDEIAELKAIAIQVLILKQKQ